MDIINTKEGVSVGYQDFGTGQTVVFAPGWESSPSVLSALMLFFCGKGYRVIACYGRQDKSSFSSSLEHRVDDFAAIIEDLDLTNIIIIGHSAASEIDRYLRQYGSKRVAKIIIVEPERIEPSSQRYMHTVNSGLGSAILEQERTAGARTLIARSTRAE